ncbi:MAG: alpha/beta hydrolase [Clostridia bacterium]|nr:alpha/beta hydrolase [Clostridia bacterium]
MVIKRDVLFTPAEEIRRLHIYLPDNYLYSNERYPVMYFFDGHNLFFNEDATYGKSWGLKEYLDGWNKDMIIVGVQCSMTNRLVEYCPYHFTKGFLGEIDGTGKATLEWMVNDLKPMIDAQYRTWSHREATAIGGASMGGLMSLYAVIRHNDVFSKAACLSSTIAPCMDDFIRDITAAQIDPDTRVYLSFGTEEGAGTKEYPRFDQRSDMEIRNGTLAEMIAKKGAISRMIAQENGRHCEADWEKQVPWFMPFLWQNR